MTVTAGSDLDEATELIFAHPGLKATQKLDANSKPIANQFVVSVDPAVEPGLYDVRLRGLFGISNPRIFRIDTIAETQEKEPNNQANQAQTIGLNTIVNARSNSAADVDYYSVAVKAEQTIVLRTEAAALDSLMQPALELYSAEGQRVAHARRRKQREAVIIYTSPVDQSLLLRIHDTVYAGSNDYPYRLSIDDRPLVDFAIPATLPAQTDTEVTLYGRHLPGGEVSVLTLNGKPLSKLTATIQLNAEQIAGTSSAATSVDTALYSGVAGNLLPFAVRPESVSDVVEVSEGEQPLLTAPVHVSGSFEKEFDEDVYRFEAKAKDVWQIDVLAHRLGSAADPLLIVEQITKGEDGSESAKRITRLDESKQNPGGNDLPTLTPDPSYLLTAPADGTYQIRLRDRFATSRGAADLTYTLSLTKSSPDFRLAIFEALPSADGKAPPTTGAVSLRKGGTYQLPVYAYRSGGHNSDIQVRLDGLPEGIACSETVIRAGQSSAVLVLTANADAAEQVTSVTVLGTAGSDAQRIERKASVATLVHSGANGLPRTGRVSSALMIGVMKDHEPFHVQPQVVSAEVSQDQQLLVPLTLTRQAGFDAKVDVAFSGQPKNVDVPKVSIDKGQTTAVARFFFKENVSAGKATLLMYATAAVPYRRNPWLAERAQAVVAEAEKKLAANKKALEDATKASEAGATRLAELQAMQKKATEQLKAAQATENKAKADVKTALAGQADATAKLKALQEKIGQVVASTKPDNEDLDAAIATLQTAAQAVEEATKPVEELVAKLAAIKTTIGAAKKEITEKNKQIAAVNAQMTEQQKVIEKAKADVAAAQQTLKTAEAAKKAADDAAKKANDATKAKNINVRTIAVPVQLNVHTTPGKLAAAVPDNGAIKKGATADVKITLTRKNKFDGPVQVALVLPEGNTAVASNTVEIAADATEGTLQLTAAADAAAADVANAVIRATADFGGRKAHFDVPVALKVVE